MRTLIICFCFLLSALGISAAGISGIRIDGGKTLFIVYVEGEQVCTPTNSCFVANLSRGYYRVQVFESRYTRPNQRPWKGKLLFDERVYVDSRDVRSIELGREYADDERHYGYRDEYRDESRDERRGERSSVMRSELFNSLVQNVKDEPFTSGRMDLIKMALVNSNFTTEQCGQLINIFSFDNEKMSIMKLMYPKIIDKERFFVLINSLSFSSSKSEIKRFIENAERR